jgi:hypothetical protein
MIADLGAEDSWTPSKADVKVSEGRVWRRESLVQRRQQIANRELFSRLSLFHEQNDMYYIAR